MKKDPFLKPITHNAADWLQWFGYMADIEVTFHYHTTFDFEQSPKEWLKERNRSQPYYDLTALLISDRGVVCMIDRASLYEIDDSSSQSFEELSKNCLHSKMGTPHTVALTYTRVVKGTDADKLIKCVQLYNTSAASKKAMDRIIAKQKSVTDRIERLEKERVQIEAELQTLSTSERITLTETEAVFEEGNTKFSFAQQPKVTAFSNQSNPYPHDPRQPGGRGWR